MRCLISLGLILPALAGVIGVVAWAVSAESVLAPAPRELSDPTVAIQDRTLYDDRYDLNDFAKLPPAKAIPPPEDDEAPDDPTRGDDPVNSLPILPAQSQLPPGTSPGEKPVYVVHFVVGDKENNGFAGDRTTTTTTVKSTAATSRVTSRMTSPSTTSSSTSTTTTTTTSTTTTPRPTPVPTPAPSTLDPRSPEFAAMLNRILSASKDGQGRAPQFVVFAPLPEDKKRPLGGFDEGTRYEAELPPKQSFLESAPGRSVGVRSHSGSPESLRLPIRPRDDYHRDPLLTQHSYLPPQQVLTRRNGSNPNPFLPPPPFQPGGNNVRAEPPEPHRPGIHSVGGFGASRLHDDDAPAPNAPYDPPPGGSPYEPPRRARYPPPPPPHYDPVDSQRGLLHPASESAAYPHKDRSGFEIHAGDSHGGGHGKGITFTIGGGDGGHGGGHSYGVSPMGVIKNLFLPFLPKPKVNLNGRVVFGVVLEKGVGLGHNQHGHHHHQHAVAYHH